MQQTLSQYGSTYVLLLGAIAVVMATNAPRGIWGWVVERWDLHLFPVRRGLVIESPPEEARAGAQRACGRVDRDRLSRSAILRRRELLVLPRARRDAASPLRTEARDLGRAAKKGREDEMREYLKKAPPKPPADVAAVRETVSSILADVRERGLEAVREYSRRFDGWDPPSFKVPADEIERAKASIASDVLASLDFAHAQIERFARLQRESMTDFEVETRPGVFLGQKHIPVANAGAYIPGGKYPMLMSAQMSILTAKVAGVERVVACAPPYKKQGIYPAMLWSMALAGADEIWCVGGVQALALMAYGADDYAPVEFISGPGNMYVAEAKRQLFGDVGIDLLAGPTEILIIVDETSDPAIVAADLLGQAEHGPTSPAWLVSLSRGMAEAVLAEVGRQLEELPTREVAEVSWRDYGEVVVVGDRDEAVAVADEYAPEHLEVQTADPGGSPTGCATTARCASARRRRSPSPTRPSARTTPCPTEKAARYTGGLWVGKFLKTVTYQRCTRDGALDIAPHAGRLSDAEQMFGHGLTAYRRLRTSTRRAAARTRQRTGSAVAGS